MEYSGARGTLIHEKKIKSKISCQTPLKHSPIVYRNGFNYTQIAFNEQAKHIPGPQTNFTFSPQPLNSLS